MEENESYQPIPVSAAHAVARDYAKDIVVIIAWERATNMVHTTTYGRKQDEKISAANLGELLTLAAGGNLSLRTKYEDFRDKTQAEWAAEKESLLAIQAELLGACKAVVAQQAASGIIRHGRLDPLHEHLKSVIAKAEGTATLSHS